MADMALCGCSKLSTSFLHTQNPLSSSESLFSHIKFSQHKHKQQKGLCVKAAAPTSVSPQPTTNVRGSPSAWREDGRPDRGAPAWRGDGDRRPDRGAPAWRGDGRPDRGAPAWREDGRPDRGPDRGARVDGRADRGGRPPYGRPSSRPPLSVDGRADRGDRPPPYGRPSTRPPLSGRPATRQPTRPPGRRLMKKEGTPRPPRNTLLGVRDAILKPPLDDTRLADKFLQSPQLSLKTLPLLSSCLPYAALRAEDEEWMKEYLPEIKVALGYPLPGMDTPTTPDSPLHHLDTFLYVAFQHLDTPRGSQKYLRVAHSRLAFLGEYILELALTEYFLVRYPRETPACMRERMFALTNKKVIPDWLRLSSFDGCISLEGSDFRPGKKLQTIRGVFWALVAALYLCMGMGEVYRLLFEVFAMDPDESSCQPKRRLGRPDADYVFAPLEEKQIDWQEVTAFKSEDDALFAKPLLYRVCVPPGMQRFRGNLWEIDSLPQVLQIMGYPLATINEDPSVTTKRNAELELGIQLCFIHPSVYKSDHPRFCNERLEFLGSKIQDVVMAEKLLMKHLDAPGYFIEEKHRRLLFNRLCGKYIREKKLQKFMVIAEKRKELFEKARRLKNFSTTGVSLALHGLAYSVYGKAEVRRLMFEFLDFERLQLPRL